MVEFNEYKDSKIRIRLPKQLRQKRPGLFFQGNLIRGEPETQMSVGIDLNFDARRVKAIKKLFRDTEVQNRPSGNKVERLGPCRYGKDGLELLTSIVQPHTGNMFYCWDLIYSMDGKYLMLSITGGASRENFEKLAKQIIESLKFT